jgi:hypothetical protein
MGSHGKWDDCDIVFIVVVTIKTKGDSKAYNAQIKK